MDLTTKQDETETQTQEEREKKKSTSKKYSKQEVEDLVNKAYASGVDDSLSQLQDLLQNRAEVNDGEEVRVDRRHVDYVLKHIEELKP